MREEKLYNIIFPIYMLWLVPPIFFLFAALNFIIDSLVILAAEKALKIDEIFSKYKKVILKAWAFGFIADFIGALFLFGVSNLLDHLKIPITYHIAYNPFGNVYAFLVTILGILIASILIYVFDKKISFKKVEWSEREKKIMALVMAIATAPYLFLLPYAA